ncbi:DUF2946 family protein [Caulobacter sp. NIBR2454]|uniref:DUF2946 family protein n=1 Tax=Caulobacter sp. NIBR2454 TaxID=3015996 RepID=UPI0022B6D162|nr:DUF2946 family protein [Caulobacter sp. NIBR2454]
MKAFRRPQRNLWGHVCMTLAALAVVMKVLIPAGFMAKPATNSLPFELVICTGEGAMVVAPGEAIAPHSDGKAQGEKSAGDAPCAFASAATGAPLPDLSNMQAVAFIEHQDAPVHTKPMLAPGRGLSAPPLPARGPPTVFI